LRDVPIITFINKLDREARDPFDLLDEFEQALALDVPPASWPIGMGRDFLGTYDLFAGSLFANITLTCRYPSKSVRARDLGSYRRPR
jgi:peptide subunit release factor RF-3